MANRVFKAIFREKVGLFKSVFQNSAHEIFWDDNTKKLIHAGEYGKYREVACKEFLRLFIPQRLDISEGFLITSKDKVSTQCDIVVYDKNNAPLIQNNERQKFFLIESICAIGEVKSNLSFSQFKDALNKLARNKALKQDAGGKPIVGRKEKLNPISNKKDHIFSFLICNKLDFDMKNINESFDEIYESDIEHHSRHGLIFSVTDGVIAYQDGEGFSVTPTNKENLLLKACMCSPNEDRHFEIFSSLVYIATTHSSIARPTIQNYLY